jgi:cytochrome bd-type quinol oxidase subunit 2
MWPSSQLKRLVVWLRDPDPIAAGMLAWLRATAVVTLVVGVVSTQMSLPSPDTMRDIANIGIVLVLAYVVEASWLIPLMKREKTEKEEDLGLLLGIGIAGLVGVVVAILLAAHREAGHGNLLDNFGLVWATYSLFALGTFVALQPYLAHSWATRPEE